MRALCAQTGSEKRVGRRFFGVRRPGGKAHFEAGVLITDGGRTVGGDVLKDA